MNDAFWTTVLAIGVVQGLFLTGALLLRPTANRVATRLLAAIVGVFTLMILGEIAERALGTTLALLAVCLTINFELAIGPSVFLFVRSILDPQRELGRRDAVHFAPLAFGLVVWGVAWWTLSAGPEPSSAAIERLPLIPYFVLFKALVLFAYAIAVMWRMTRGLRESRRFSAGRRAVRLDWLKRWLLGLGAIPLTIYLVVFLEQAGFELVVESDEVRGLLLTMTIYLTSLMVLLRPWVLSLTPHPDGIGRWAREAAEITAYFDRERPWLEPELGLGDLAAALGSTEKRLSAVINEGLETSFYGLLTRYRLAEFERLARDPFQRERGVLDLAFEAGFNSKASFYRAFREAYGTTPTAFRRGL